MLLVAGVALHPACGGPTEILASDFDQACVDDSDCTGVFDGEVCGGCGPGHPAAIASSAARAFQDQLNSMSGNCSHGCFGGSAACSLMGAPDPHCVAGTCTQCAVCPDAGSEPDTGFVLPDAQTCPPPADVAPGAFCWSYANTPTSCAGEVVACDGGIEATTCVCQNEASQWAWACASSKPACGDAGAGDAALDAPFDSDAGD